MIRTTVKAQISVAHHLRKPYVGKCSRRHGHNYQIEATFEAEEPDERGFVGVDFSEFKEFLKKWDHKDLNDCSPFDIKQPSVENIAWAIGVAFQDKNCIRVKVWETPTGMAEWFRDDPLPS